MEYDQKADLLRLSTILIYILATWIFRNDIFIFFSLARAWGGVQETAQAHLSPVRVEGNFACIRMTNKWGTFFCKETNRANFFPQKFWRPVVFSALLPDITIQFSYWPQFRVSLTGPFLSAGHILIPTINIHCIVLLAATTSLLVVSSTRRLQDAV